VRYNNVSSVSEVTSRSLAHQQRITGVEYVEMLAGEKRTRTPCQALTFFNIQQLDNEVRET